MNEPKMIDHPVEIRDSKYVIKAARKLSDPEIIETLYHHFGRSNRAAEKPGKPTIIYHIDQKP